MSRIGNKPIELPKGVGITLAAGLVTVKGAKGELKVPVTTELSIKEENGALTVSRPSDSRTHRALHGLTRTLVANAVQGVSSGYQRNLELHGALSLSGEPEAGRLQAGFEVYGFRNGETPVALAK